MEHMNCGFNKVEILSGNVGYVKFDMFADPEICGLTATAAMNFLGNVDAIIFDLRDNGGGDPKMVALVSSYLSGECVRETNENRTNYHRGTRMRRAVDDQLEYDVHDDPQGD
jgi:C-terminal processing protease CtpA/Prc